MKRKPVTRKAPLPLEDAYRALLATLEALPATRMRALAITDLESSFTRAVFATSEVESPIRYVRP